MKKILSIFLVSLFLLSAMTVAISAYDFTGLKTIEPDPNAETINNVSQLDFSEPQNSLWAAYDEKTGTWYDPETGYCPYVEDTDDPDADTQLSFMLSDFTKAQQYLANLDWGFTENGEVLHVAAKNTSNAGFGFAWYDGVYNGINVGSESSEKPYAEYFKIRVRNYSSATKITFGFSNSNINNGNYTDVPQVSVSNLEIESNSGEWQEIVFSMRSINSDTNYKDVLVKDANGVPNTRWGSTLRVLYFFPFGYGDFASGYSGATMDIDYIVFGSKEFVTNYKSDLQIAEANVDKIELVSAPSKTTYYVGETIDLTGLQLKATYKDGSDPEILTSCGAVYNFEEAADSTTVTLKYGEATVTYDVKVIGIEKIEIETEPSTLTYKQSEIDANGFTPTGLTILVTFADGTTKIVGLGEFNLAYDFIGSGKQSVSVNYHGAKCGFEIELINVTAITVAELSTPIYFGDTLTAANLDITCVYSDESTGSFKDSGFDEDYITVTYEPTYGKTNVVVTYTSPSLEAPLTYTTTGTYAQPTALEVTNNGGKTEYEVDDLFVIDGFEFALVYEDGKKVKIASTDLTKDPTYDFSASGATAVTFEFDGLTASVDANVKAVEIVTKASTSATKDTKPSSSGSSAIVIVIIVVAVLAVAAVAVVLVLKKKKK